MSRPLLASISGFALGVLAGCGGGGGGAPPGPGPGPDPGGNLSVSGVARAADYAQADTDTNVDTIDRVRNNGFETAQPVPNQFRLGGYVNQPGAGPQGPLRTIGDEVDVFSVELLRGQFVNLYIGNVDNGDLDLILFDENRVEAGRSVSETSNVESVPIPRDGRYFVVVNAFSGFGTYVLGAGGVAAANHAMRSDAAIIPGQVIVEFDEGAQTTAKRGGTPAAKAAGLGMQWLGGGEGQPMLFGFSSPQQKARARAALGLHTPRAKALDAELGEKIETLAIVKALNAEPGVRHAEPALRRQIRRVPNDPLYDAQWHFPQINLPQAWDVTTGSDNVLIGVIDTGVLVFHPDLVANLDRNDPDGFDFIGDVPTANDGDGRDGNANDSGDLADPDGGASYHGTHCAGVVSAASNNGSGVAGVNWNAQIMPLRALGVGGGSSFDVLQAMRYAARLPNASGQLPAKRVDILSMSLGGPDFSQSEENTIAEVRAQGVIIVAAAGNSGNSALEYPASYEGVVSVAATTITRARAFYSQANNRVDVAAPGGDVSTDINGDEIPDGVFSTFGNGAPGRADFDFSFRTLMGTSMATPHVAGVIALMKALHPGLTPAEFDAELIAGRLTDDLGAAGRDNSFGHGLINAAKAVAAAQRLASNQPAPVMAPILVANPESANFGVTRTAIDLTLSNGGGGTLNVTSVSDDQPWLTVSPIALSPDGTGSYRLTVSRAGLPPGLYEGVITVVASSNTLRIPVSMEVSDAGIVVPSAGYLFLLLIDAEAESTQSVAELEVAPVNGEYPFRFDDIPPGRYFIVAGTDSDNDREICDEGEACGFFPADNDDFVLGDTPLSGVSFPVSFEVGVSTNSASAQDVGRQGYRRK